MKRQMKVSCVWTADLAYAVGIITTDGNLSPGGRHINITSKDKEVVDTLKNVLRLTNKIGRKARGSSSEKTYFVLQFGDKNFYEFLGSIGLMQAKSRKLARISIPDDYFIDFFRGCIDGDGSIGAFKHPECRRPQLRLRLVSASPPFLDFVHAQIQRLYGIKGGYTYPSSRVWTLAFGTKDTVKLLGLMYYADHLPALARKRATAEQLLKKGE